MWDVFGHVLGPILRIFGLVWMEDDRPGARWFSVGCLAILLAVIGIAMLIYTS
jgi:hypothetical protein